MNLLEHAQDKAAEARRIYRKADEEERELARFRLHLIKHRSMLKQRVHETERRTGRRSPYRGSWCSSVLATRC